MPLSRSWLLLTLPVAIVAIGVLTRVAMSLVRATRSAIVASVPVRAEQRVTFDRAGELALSIESDALTRTRLGLQFALSTVDGVAVPMRRALAPVKVSSFTRARTELLRLTLPAPGEYVLRAAGAEALRDGDAIVFTRPLGTALVAHVLALVALGGVLVGSLVVSGFALAGRSLAPNAP